MSLVNRDSLLRQVLHIVAEIEPPAGIELLSYKRNRRVSVTAGPGTYVTVRERGYEELDTTVEREELSRTLKAIIKREFPRSRKIRLQKLSDPEDLDRPRKKL